MIYARCIKDFRMNQFYHFRKGEFYVIDGFVGMSEDLISVDGISFTINKDGSPFSKKDVHWFYYNYFDKKRYTKRDIRRIKLDKINEKRIR